MCSFGFPVGLLSASGVDAAGRLLLAGNAKYTSHTARDDMLTALHAPVLADTLAMLEGASFIGVMVDETTDVSNLGQMAVHVRCVVDGRIVNRFAGVCEVAERDAVSIQQALEEKFESLGRSLWVLTLNL